MSRHRTHARTAVMISPDASPREILCADLAESARKLGLSAGAIYDIYTSDEEGGNAHSSIIMLRDNVRRTLAAIIALETFDKVNPP